MIWINDDSDYDEVVQSIKTTNQHSFLLHAEGKQSIKLLKSAEKAGLLKEDYRWIFTDDVSFSFYERLGEIKTDNNVFTVTPSFDKKQLETDYNTGNFMSIEHIRNHFLQSGMNLYQHRYVDALLLVLQLLDEQNIENNLETPLYDILKSGSCKTYQGLTHTYNFRTDGGLSNGEFDIDMIINTKSSETPERTIFWKFFAINQKLETTKMDDNKRGFLAKHGSFIQG